MHPASTDLFIPALPLQLLPLLSLGKVIRIHRLLRRVPVIQTPFRKLGKKNIIRIYQILYSTYIRKNHTPRLKPVQKWINNPVPGHLSLL